jgi:hypothetical protein
MWRALLCMMILSSLLVLTSCSSSAQRTPTPDDVATAEFSLGVMNPGPAEAPRSLLGSDPADRKVIAKLLGWVKSAPVVGEGLTALPSLGAHMIVFHLKNGKACSAVVKGGRGSGPVVVWACGGGQPVHLNAPELGNWLDTEWQKDLG